MHHAPALRVFQDANPIIVPNEVLVELMGLMGARLGRKAANVALEALRTSRLVELTHNIDAFAVCEMQAQNPSLRLVGASVVWHARKLGAHVGTRDSAIEALMLKK